MGKQRFSNGQWASFVEYTHTPVPFTTSVVKDWGHKTWWLEIKAMANSSVSGTWFVRPDETHFGKHKCRFLFCSFFSVVCVVHNGELVFGQPIDIFRALFVDVPQVDHVFGYLGFISWHRLSFCANTRQLSRSLWVRFRTYRRYIPCFVWKVQTRMFAKNTLDLRDMESV